MTKLAEVRTQVLQSKQIPADDLDYLLAERLEMTPSQFQLNQDLELTDEQLTQLEADVEQLAKGQSVQYILGYAWFYGYKISLLKRVLIPRFDTEELVAWALESVASEQTILDLGTGSGAIMVALANEAKKKGISNLKLFASDIKDNCLLNAEENFLTYDLDVATRKADVLVGLGKFDLIISNPPYIKPSEIPLMDQSVLKNEPASALFGGDDGLEFYRKFAKQVRDHLSSKGEFFLEFGFDQQAQLSDLFAQELPDFDIEFRKDMAGKDRMVHGKWRK